MSMSGLAGLAGYLGNTSGARTGTSVTSNLFTPEQTAIQNEYGANIEQGLTNPTQTPEYESGVDAINKSYAGAEDNLTKSLAARGFGKSGGVGSGIQAIDMAKAGAVGNESNVVENQAMQEAQNFGFADPGKSTVSVGPGSAAAGGLGATLASLQAGLNAGLSGGGL